MTAGGTRNAAVLPVLLAGLWPLGVYTQVPFTPVWLSHAAGVALAAAAAFRWRATRASRPPFELWWPCAALAVVVVLAMRSPEAGAGPGLLVHAAFFLAAGMLAPGRGTVALACLAFGVAGAGSAMLHAAAQAGWLPPTAIALEPGLGLSGPGSVSGGMLLVFHAFLAALFAAAHPGLRAWQRYLAAGAAAVSCAWLGFLLPHLPVLASPETFRQFLLSPGLDAAALLITLWLVARVAARGLCRPARTGMPARFLAPGLITAGAAGCLVWGAAPDPSAALLLGLIAAHEAPWATDEAVGPSRALLWPALACVAVQVAGVLPLAAGDPRNQAARAEALLKAEQWAALDGSLAFLRARAPGRPDYALLHARSLAAQGWPAAAAAVYCAADYPDGAAGGGFAYGVHRRALLDTLRDHASRRAPGERGLFFEQALIHDGEVDNALEFLALDSPVPPEGYEYDREVLAPALAALLGDPGLASRLAAEDARTLMGYFAGAGIRIAFAPPGFPEGRAPLMLDAAPGPGFLRILVWPDAAGAPATTRTLAYAGAAAGGPAAWGEWDPGRGAWTLALHAPPHTLASVVLRTAGEIGVVPGGGPGPSRGPAATVLYVP